MDAMLRDADLRVLSWQSARVERINGEPALKVQYTRSDRAGPVGVTQYIFVRPERNWTVTTSFRLSEERVWRAILDRVLNSLRLPP